MKYLPDYLVKHISVEAADGDLPRLHPRFVYEIPASEDCQNKLAIIQQFKAQFPAQEDIDLLHICEQDGITSPISVQISLARVLMSGQITAIIARITVFFNEYDSCFDTVFQNATMK